MSNDFGVKMYLLSSAKDWSWWKELFMARINRKDSNMMKVIDLQNEFELSGIDKEGAETKSTIKNKILARKVYEELLISMDKDTPLGRSAIGVITGAKFADGTGNGRLAFDHLQQRFEPRTSLAKGELLCKFYSAKCRENSDPESFVY